MITALRLGLKIIIPVSVGTVVNNIVRATTPIISSGLERTLTTIGAMAISYVIGEKISDAIDEDIQELVEKYGKKTS